MRVNNIDITTETIQQTREWFAQNARDCADGAVSGEYRVNDLPRYIEWQRRREREALRGDYDHVLAFIQRALYIQTGESVPLFAGRN